MFKFGGELNKKKAQKSCVMAFLFNMEGCSRKRGVQEKGFTVQAVN